MTAGTCVHVVRDGSNLSVMQAINDQIGRPTPRCNARPTFPASGLHGCACRAHITYETYSRSTSPTVSECFFSRFCIFILSTYERGKPVVRSLDKTSKVSQRRAIYNLFHRRGPVGWKSCIAVTSTSEWELRGFFIFGTLLDEVWDLVSAMVAEKQLDLR